MTNKKGGNSNNIDIINSFKNLPTGGVVNLSNVWQFIAIFATLQK
jgi:hypothetical protein